MTTQMRTNSSRLHWLLLGIFLLLTVAIGLLYSRLSKRLDSLESATNTLAAIQKSDRSSIAAALTSEGGLSNSRTPQFRNASSPAPDELVRRLSQRTPANPAMLAASMDQAMQFEPSIPSIESKQSQWLESAFQTMPSDAPKVSGAQSTCRGRRCLVSGSFNNQEDAQDWADRYLLTAGGKFLQNSRTLLVPAGNNKTKLLLYLY